MTLTNARQSLPAIVDEVIATRRPVVITRRGVPVAQLTAYVDAKCESSVYPLRGVALDIPEDFDDQLPIRWDALA